MSTSAIASLTMSRLLSRQFIAERTWALHFRKPTGWRFKPGQFLDVSLIAPSQTDAEGDTRTFSIASAPQEEALMVATRLRGSAFKREMVNMPLGALVNLAGPSGDLTLDSNVKRAAVLLAGGIGITPFRSMVVHAAREKRDQRIFLFYSNRRPEDAPFLKELKSIEKTNPYYKLIASMTKIEASGQPWCGETGIIDKEMLARHLKGVISPIYYIAGPPGMVQGLRNMVHKAGVADADIRAEEFAGY